ncbi:thiol:disulfide interchange protein [Pelomonas sp. HMWF004]|nr:thiol:disulfide interchange protein [Pelomonas sp. HMWF004]
MNSILQRIAMTALLLVVGVNTAFADDFKDRLVKKFPQTADAKIAPAWPGFHSVVRGEEVLYFNEDLTIMVAGDVIDLKRNASMTNEIRQANRPKISLKDLPLGDSIKLTSGTRKLYIFADPDCYYCRKLEKEFPELRDVEIRIFPFPLEGIHPGASKVTESIWCASDRAAAWNAYFALSQKPQDATCPNPIIRNTALAQKLRIMGTPALIFEDGTLIPSAISAAQINAKLDSVGVKQ